MNCFHRQGAPAPREFVCDGSRALLNAAVHTYSGYVNIEEYANSMETSIITTRIRMDVAHFLNVYRKLLRGLHRIVRTLYMAAIGKLVVSTSKDEAGDIVRSMILLSKCEFEGITDDGQETECFIKKKWLKELVTGKFFNQVINPQHDKNKFFSFHLKIFNKKKNIYSFL